MMMTSPLLAGMMPTGESMMAFSIAWNIFLSQGLIEIVLRSGVVIVATLFRGTSEPYEFTRTQSRICTLALPARM